VAVLNLRNSSVSRLGFAQIFSAVQEKSHFIPIKETLTRIRRQKVELTFIPKNRGGTTLFQFNKK